MLPEAKVVHTMPGRMRLRVPDHKGDSAYFARVEQKLMGAAGITNIVTSPLTASVLVLFSGDESAVLEAAVERELFQRAPDATAEPSLLALASKRMDRFERTVDEVTTGRFNLFELLFTGLVGAALLQAIRGQLLGPSSTLLSYAVALIYFYRTRRQTR